MHAISVQKEGPALGVALVRQAYWKEPWQKRVYPMAFL